MSDIVTRIDMGDIPILEKQGRNTVGHAEFSAVRQLQPGEAIKFPCRWHHHGKGQGSCAGVLNTLRNGRVHGFRLHSICHEVDGERTVYVGRLDSGK